MVESGKMQISFSILKDFIWNSLREKDCAVSLILFEVDINTLTAQELSSFDILLAKLPVVRTPVSFRDKLRKCLVEFLAVLTQSGTPMRYFPSSSRSCFNQISLTFTSTFTR